MASSPFAVVANMRLRAAAALALHDPDPETLPARTDRALAELLRTRCVEEEDLDLMEGFLAAGVYPIDAHYEIEASCRALGIDVANPLPPRTDRGSQG